MSNPRFWSPEMLPLGKMCSGLSRCQGPGTSEMGLQGKGRWEAWGQRDRNNKAMRTVQRPTDANLDLGTKIPGSCPTPCHPVSVSPTYLRAPSIQMGCAQPRLEGRRGPDERSRRCSEYVPREVCPKPAHPFTHPGLIGSESHTQERSKNKSCLWEAPGRADQPWTGAQLGAWKVRTELGRLGWEAGTSWAMSGMSGKD